MDLIIVLAVLNLCSDTRLESVIQVMTPIAVHRKSMQEASTAAKINNRLLRVRSPTEKGRNGF